MPNPLHPYYTLQKICESYSARLLAVTKTRTEKEILDLYNMGQTAFGENRAHELVVKASLLPTELEWHMIGHLQTNKVKALLPYVNCIQSIDSLRLLEKINEECNEHHQHVNGLLQIKIAKEETKYGWDYNELIQSLDENIIQKNTCVKISGVMGMASLSEDENQVRKEFKTLRQYFEKIKSTYYSDDTSFKTLSMGMSGDYRIALEEGSNMIRIGSLLFI